MVFISGIHGVGKSYFLEKVKDKCNIKAYTASALISEYKKCIFDSDKRECDIINNQKILLDALRYKQLKDNKFILDGHFCLINGSGKIERIEINTYKDLNPKAIVLLKEKSEVIAERRYKRDNIIMDIPFINAFQDEEERYALEVSDTLKVPIYISNGSQDSGKAIDFITRRM